MQLNCYRFKRWGRYKTWKNFNDLFKKLFLIRLSGIQYSNSTNSENTSTKVPVLLPTPQLAYLTFWNFVIVIWVTCLQCSWLYGLNIWMYLISIPPIMCRLAHLVSVLHTCLLLCLSLISFLSYNFCHRGL